MAQTSEDSVELNHQKVQAACSKCVYHTSKHCGLAVEIDGKIYEVEGSNLKDHGNPHKKDGMCRIERDAEVSGKIEDGKFIAYEFELLPMDKTELPLMKEEDTDG